MKQLIITAAALALAGSLHAQKPAAAAAPVATPKIVAIVNGETITLDDLNRLYQSLAPKLRENYEAGGGRGQFLDQYIRKHLLVQEALKNNFDKRADTQALLRDARESSLFDLYVRKVIASNVVSDADVRSYYDAHVADYKTAERVHASHIIATPVAESFVPNTTKDNAKNEEEAQRKMKNLVDLYHISPSNFSDLAIRFSEDASALSGGDLGWFERGRMVKEFEDAAFATPKGTVSPLIKTQYGYHYIYVNDHRPAGVRPFDDVRNDIRERLLSERAEKVLTEVNSLTQELQGQSRIHVYKENIPDTHATFPSPRLRGEGRERGRATWWTGGSTGVGVMSSASCTAIHAQPLSLLSLSPQAGRGTIVPRTLHMKPHASHSPLAPFPSRLASPTLLPVEFSYSPRFPRQAESSAAAQSVQNCFSPRKRERYHR